MEIILDMKYHLIYALETEKKVLEINTNNIPRNIGDLVQLPLGKKGNVSVLCCRCLLRTQKPRNDYFLY